MTPNDLLVNVQNLSKVYQMGLNEVVALKNVNLQIRKGDSLAIMGPSGSGKSTLMHLLGCLDKPTTGQYWLNNQDISLLDDKALSLIRSKQIGFVFQSFNLIPQLNVVENVEIPFIYQGAKPNEKKFQIVEALKRVGLAHRLDHVPRELSGGEMQRVAIARALAINPTLILADEPTGNLDYENGKAILQLFQELNAQGVTIVLVTHDQFVGEHCRRIICMRDGEIIEEDQSHVIHR